MIKKSKQIPLAVQDFAEYMNCGYQMIDADQRFKEPLVKIKSFVRGGVYHFVDQVLSLNIKESNLSEFLDRISSVYEVEFDPYTLNQWFFTEHLESLLVEED